MMNWYGDKGTIEEIEMTETAVQEIEITEAPTTTQRVAPWLRIGALPENVQFSNTESVLHEAELDFTVSKRPIQFQRLDGTWADSKDRMYVARDDNDKQIDVVSSDYGVFQYAQAFEFLDHIPGAQFISAGPLRDGRQAFIVVKLPDLEGFDVAGSDHHELNVVIRTSHDRSRAVEVFTMPMRVWCTNQLPIRGMGMGITNRWAVNHIGNVEAKMHDAEVMIIRVRDYVEDFKITAQRLVDTRLDSSDGEFVLGKVLRDTVKKEEVTEHIMNLWRNADTVGYSDCGWGLVNAVSDYFEHGRRGGTAQSRFLGALEGQTRGILDKTVPLILGRFSARV
jgi:phage/plasmid-like protein (TIGR03299 family)